MSTAIDRARGALYGLAIGDALGMPTQLMSHEEVAACFGVLDGFREPPAYHLIAAGLRRLWLRDVYQFDPANDPAPTISRRAVVG